MTMVAQFKNWFFFGGGGGMGKFPLFVYMFFIHNHFTMYTNFSRKYILLLNKIQALIPIRLILGVG